jgi:hypothetical protein
MSGIEQSAAAAEQQATTTAAERNRYSNVAGPIWSRGHEMVGPAVCIRLGRARIGAIRRSEIIRCRPTGAAGIFAACGDERQ